MTNQQHYQNKKYNTPGNTFMDDFLKNVEN